MDISICTSGKGKKTLKNRILEHIILPSSPSEPGPLADSAGAMNQSTSKTLESDGPMDLSTPSKKSTLSGSPVEEEPLELDQGQLASCSTAPSPMPLSTNTEDDLDNSNFNEQMLDKGMKTPSKGMKRKLVFTPPASSPSSARSSDTDKTGQDKGPKRLFPSPSPGKRWLAQIPENENTQSETIEEMAEMVQYGQICHGPVKVSF